MLSLRKGQGEEDSQEGSRQIPPRQGAQRLPDPCSPWDRDAPAHPSRSPAWQLCGGARDPVGVAAGSSAGVTVLRPPGSPCRSQIHHCPGGDPLLSRGCWGSPGIPACPWAPHCLGSPGIPALPWAPHCLGSPGIPACP